MRDIDPRGHSFQVFRLSDLKLLKTVYFDTGSGALSMDTAFHDASGKPGFGFGDRAWPHGWTGSANPHGVVFSR